MAAVQLNWNHYIIRNFCLVISKKRFEKVVNFSYEKHFSKDNFNVVEYYTNFKKSLYFKTETTYFFEITRGFSSTMELFCIEVTYKNKLGKPYASYEWLDTEPEFYRRINASGAHSEKTFDTFWECIQYHGEQII